MVSRVRIVLADDHLLVREGLRALLEAKGHDVCGEASDGREILRLVREIEPEIALLDISMPNLNGLDAVREIRRLVPSVKPMLLTMYDEKPYVLEGLRAGARGYVLKSQASRDLAQAIEVVMAGSVYLSPDVAVSVVDAYLDPSDTGVNMLTPRERQVLQLIAEGNTTKKVANILCISFKTAESHRNRIMKKLDIHETASLVRYAVRNGLMQA